MCVYDTWIVDDNNNTNPQTKNNIFLSFRQIYFKELNYEKKTTIIKLIVYAMQSVLFAHLSGIA